MTFVVFVAVAGAVWAVELYRLTRALHVFQLEGYKRGRFLEWCRKHHDRTHFLSRAKAKKPLVMTGRATRILVTSAGLAALAMVVVPAIVWAYVAVAVGAVVWLVTAGATLLFTPWLLVAADRLLDPVQRRINGRYMRMAAERLRQVAPVVVGITGSFGKTSTKFAVQHLLGDPGEVLATPGSFNTPLGVCRTINEHLHPGHGAFVVEMGAYAEGDIAELCRFVRPTIGVLTAIGPAHLERFGSIDAIRRAKYEIVTSLPPHGTAVMNVDDPEVRALADQTHGVRVVRYGVDPEGEPEVTAQDVAVTPKGTAFKLTAEGESIAVTTRLLGRHAVGHILAAAAVALASGRDLASLKPRIERLQPVEHRLQLLDGSGGVTVIDDAYNSNPEGAAAALEVLEAMPARRRVVVTPGIVELGPLQEDENRRFGERAGQVADVLIVVAGLNRRALVEGASSGEAEVITVDTLEEATTKLRGILAAGDVVLFENDLPDQYEG